MRHLAIFSFLIFPSLIESYMWDSVCWPVMILSTLPSRKWRHFCNAFTIAHAYFSTECHLCSKCDRVLEEKATYRSPGLIERCCQRVFWSIHLRNWVFYKKFQRIEWIYLISPKLKFCTSKYCMIDLRIFFPIHCKYYENKTITYFNGFISVGTGKIFNGWSLSGSGFILHFSMQKPSNRTWNVDAIVSSSLNVRLNFLAASRIFIAFASCSACIFPWTFKLSTYSNISFNPSSWIILSTICSDQENPVRDAKRNSAEFKQLSVSLQCYKIFLLFSDGHLTVAQLQAKVLYTVYSAKFRVICEIFIIRYETSLIWE